MLFDRTQFAAHRRWLIAVSVPAALAVLWFIAEVMKSPSREFPRGSSAMGLTLGIIAGVIFVFEFLYWPRRFHAVRAWRIGRAETWLRAHIWLGVLTFPLIWLHSGFRFGGTFTSLFMVLYLLTFASGLYGCYMQIVIPRRLLDEVPHETIHSQIEAVMKQHAADAARLTAAVTGDVSLMAAAGAEYERPPRSEELRRLGTMREPVLTFEESESAVIPHTEALREAFLAKILPFLSSPRENSPLARNARAAEYFAELKRHSPPAAYGAIDRLADYAEKQRNLLKQRRLTFHLQAWQSIHLPLSAALMILLVVHCVTALRYSVRLW